MTWEWSEVYWQALTRIEAEETLLRIRVEHSPNMKRDAKDRWTRELAKMANPPDPNAPVLTSKQLAEKLRESMRG